MNIRKAMNPTFINASAVVRTETKINRVRRDRSHNGVRNFRNPRPTTTVVPPDTARNMAKTVRSPVGGWRVT
jgi:hypothetical protein